MFKDLGRERLTHGVARHDFAQGLFNMIPTYLMQKMMFKAMTKAY